MEENKKKISQSELRRFMSAHKRKASENTKKIESPLAKYPLITFYVSKKCHLLKFLLYIFFKQLIFIYIDIICIYRFIFYVIILN